MTTGRDFRESLYIDMSSKVLAEHIYEVAHKMEASRDEYLNRLKNDSGTMEDLVVLMVNIGAGHNLTGKESLLADCYKHAVELVQKIDEYHSVANNLQILPEHPIRLTLSQAKEYGL